MLFEFEWMLLGTLHSLSETLYREEKVGNLPLYEIATKIIFVSGVYTVAAQLGLGP